MVDHASMRLGRKPARRDKRTLKLAKYMTPALTIGALAALTILFITTRRGKSWAGVEWAEED